MKGKEENQLPPDFDPNRRKFLKLLFFISTLPLSGCVANIDTTNGEGRDVGEREKEGERWRVVRSVYVYPFSGKREAWQKPPPSIDLGSLVLESDIRKAMRDIFKFLFETEYGWKSSFSSSKLYEQFSDGKHPQEVFRSLERIFTSGASSEEGLPFWTRIEFIRGGFSSIDENTFNKLMQQIINEGLSNQESRFRLVGYIPDIKQSRYSNIPRLLLLVEDKDTKTLFFIKTISANDLRREIGALKILKEVFGEEAPIPTTCVFRLQRSPNNRLTIIITEALTSAEPLTNQNLRVASSFYSIMYGKRLFESLSELERKQIADAYFEIYKRWIESMVKASSQEGGGWVISPDAIAPRNVLLIKGETGYKTAVVDGAASRITGFRISFSDKWGITTNVDWINRGIRGLRGVLNDLGIDNTEILKVEKAIFEGSISSTILPDEVLVEPNSSFEITARPIDIDNFPLVPQDGVQRLLRLEEVKSPSVFPSNELPLPSDIFELLKGGVIVLGTEALAKILEVALREVDEKLELFPHIPTLSHRNTYWREGLLVNDSLVYYVTAGGSGGNQPMFRGESIGDPYLNRILRGPDDNFIFPLGVLPLANDGMAIYRLPIRRILKALKLREIYVAWCQANEAAYRELDMGFSQSSDFSENSSEDSNFPPLSRALQISLGNFFGRMEENKDRLEVFAWITNEGDILVFLPLPTGILQEERGVDYILVPKIISLYSQNKLKKEILDKIDKELQILIISGKIKEVFEMLAQNSAVHETFFYTFTSPLSLTPDKGILQLVFGGLIEDELELRRVSFPSQVKIEYLKEIIEVLMPFCLVVNSH